MSSVLLTDTKVVGHSLLVIETTTERYQVTKPIYASKLIDDAVHDFDYQSDSDLLEKYVRVVIDVGDMTKKVNEDVLSFYTTVLLRALHMFNGQPAALIFSGVERNDDLHVTSWANRFDHVPKAARIEAARLDIDKFVAAVNKVLDGEAE